MKSVKLVYNGDLARAIEDWAATQAASRRASQQGQLAMLEQRLASIRMRAQATLFQQQQQQQGNEQQQQQGPQAPQPAQASFHFAVPELRQQQQQNGAAGPSNANPFRVAGVPAAAAAAGAGAGDAGIGGGASGALHMMRTSSAALAQVATMVSKAVWLVALLLSCWFQCCQVLVLKSNQHTLLQCSAC
jgi:hypothetical protein